LVLTVQTMDCTFLTGGDRENVRLLEKDVLPSYLQNQRWYGITSDRPPNVRIERALSLSDLGTILILAVTSDHETRWYLLPVRAIWDEGLVPKSSVITELKKESDRGWLVDAFGDDSFVRELIRGICTRFNAAPAGRFIFNRSPFFSMSPDYPDNVQMKRPNAEQSNTSIIAGDAIIKGFRRLEPGIHPEVEVGAFLSDIVRFANVPQLLGSVEYTLPETEAPLTLCVMQRFIRNSIDGWKYFVAELGKSPEPDRPSLLLLAQKLGKRTAELHRAFASGTEPSFAPEPVSPEWLARWSKTLAADVDAVFKSLQRYKSPKVRQSSEELLSRRSELLARIAHLIPEGTTAYLTRLHGDFHLGQTLITADDVFIVDFEGEPMRPLAERRGKYLPLRDVAGMLRSFDYAFATARRKRAEQRQEALDEGFAARIKSAFGHRYHDEIAGCLSFPNDPAQTDNFLQLLLIEKSLYEIRYELSNRPDWLQIPIDGLISILNERVPIFFRGGSS
jgi:trehalose synthase-fused probable maltokinase